MLVERDRANMRTDITKDDLERLYHGDKLNPYQIADVFVKCVEEVYAYRGKIAIEIAYNKSNKYEIVDHYKTIYADRYVRESNDPTRKNPIIRVKVGGKNLARAFIDNAYTILRSFHTPNNTT